MEEQDEIKKIEIKDLRVGRTPAMRMNNFYSLATILIMSVVMIWYVNYVLPEQEKIKIKEQQEAKQRIKALDEYEKRQAQIELSQKLHKDHKE